MKTIEAINAAAAGHASPVEIYWDSQDKTNVGVAYRYTDGSDSGSCEFVAWSAICDGYELGNFFDGDGQYLGPDCDGIYPLFGVSPATMQASTSLSG
jgi:hypothetical protein